MTPEENKEYVADRDKEIETIADSIEATQKLDEELQAEWNRVAAWAKHFEANPTGSNALNLAALAQIRIAVQRLGVAEAQTQALLASGIVALNEINRLLLVMLKKM